MKRRKRRDSRVPLRKRPFGIETFRVQGCIATGRVHAQWNGRWVEASTALWDQAQIAIAVDDAFLESDVRGSRLELLKGTPEELMFAMITCCDVIELAEYELSGHRRVISA
jgi:hypothetical protein